VSNKRAWNESKNNFLEEEKTKINEKYDKEYEKKAIENKM